MALEYIYLIDFYCFYFFSNEALLYVIDELPAAGAFSGAVNQYYQKVQALDIVNLIFRHDCFSPGCI